MWVCLQHLEDHSYVYKANRVSSEDLELKSDKMLNLKENMWKGFDSFVPIAYWNFILV